MTLPPVGANTADGIRPGQDAAQLCSLTEGVWGALQVVSPQGIERATLEEIAEAVGVDLDVLLGEDRRLTPDLRPSSNREDGAERGAAGRRPADASEIVTADLSKLALLSTAPHTHEDSATPLRETFRSAMHNLAVNKTRGLLTILDIIIGVCAVAFMLALGNGLLGYVNDLTGQYGANNVTIQPARLIVNSVDTGSLSRSLSLADARALADPANVPDAIAISPAVQMRALTRAGNANIATTVLGVWPDYLTAGGYNLTTG